MYMCRVRPAGCAPGAGATGVAARVTLGPTAYRSSLSYVATCRHRTQHCDGQQAHAKAQITAQSQDGLRTAGQGRPATLES